VAGFFPTQKNLRACAILPGWLGNVMGLTFWKNMFVSYFFTILKLVELTNEFRLRLMTYSKRLVLNFF